MRPRDWDHMPWPARRRWEARQRATTARALVASLAPTTPVLDEARQLLDRMPPEPAWAKAARRAVLDYEITHRPEAAA